MIAVLGAGAFGTALAIALARKGPVTLWGRNAAQMTAMQTTRRSVGRLPDVPLPDGLIATNELSLVRSDISLLCIPTQTLAGFVASHDLPGDPVACCKGIDLQTGIGPVDTLAQTKGALLTGPSFATDIAAGLPTALTLACRDAEHVQMLQSRLSTEKLRIYTTTDVTGAELGGALKNVIAIACGAATGAGLGASAAAALMTRGFSEMQALAIALGADLRTLQGLAGLGDLVLTATNTASRNFRYGLALGQGTEFDPLTTVEGKATAQAVLPLAARHGIEMPVTTAVADLVTSRTTVDKAMKTLMSRPLKEE